MSRAPGVPLLSLGLAMGLALAGCTSTSDGEVAAGHSHAGGGQVSLAVGDGTSISEVGYTLSGVQLVEKRDRLSQVRFRIDDHEGEPLTDFIEDQTKKLHLYLVNDELTVFRHLHPTLAADGTWTAPVDVPDAGAYRVIAEFTAEDEGGNGDHVILGRSLGLPPGDPGDTAALDEVVDVTVAEAPRVGDNGLLRLVVRDGEAEPVELGTYLGAYAHVTGFNRETDAMVHLHPLDAPEVTEDGTELTFHAAIEEPGDYRLFVQVRVDGFLHTVPVELTVAPSP
jgi:hypothetical protein